MILLLNRLLVRQAPDLRRRSVVRLADDRVEPAHASETWCECNVSHWQPGFVDQFLGEVQTTSLRYRAWRRTQVPDKQPSKMTRPYSQSLREAFHSALFQGAFPDQAKSSRNRARSSEPGWSPRRTFRAATQTRAEPGFSRGGRSWKVADILFFHCWHRANWTAIDPCAAHTYEELAVEARIARQPRSWTYLPVQCHYFATLEINSDRPPRPSLHYSRGCRSGWTFSDLDHMASNEIGERGPKTSNVHSSISI